MAAWRLVDTVPRGIATCQQRSVHPAPFASVGRCKQAQWAAHTSNMTCPRPALTAQTSALPPVGSGSVNSMQRSSWYGLLPWLCAQPTVNSGAPTGCGRETWRGHCRPLLAREQRGSPGGVQAGTIAIVQACIRATEQGLPPTRRLRDWSRSAPRRLTSPAAPPSLVAGGGEAPRPLLAPLAPALWALALPRPPWLPPGAGSEALPPAGPSAGAIHCAVAAMGGRGMGWAGARLLGGTWGGAGRGRLAGLGGRCAGPPLIACGWWRVVCAAAKLGCRAPCGLDAGGAGVLLRHAALHKCACGGP